MEKRALGKGLEALIQPKAGDGGLQERVLQIAISQVKTNKYQPRVEFNQERLKDLISSIKEKGVVQPVLVRRSPDGYELIAGERRLRAVKSLGMDTIPAIVRDVKDIDMLEISLIENIQREELNPIEEAHAFQRFVTDFNFTEERIAQALGKDRTTIANIIRLLKLPQKIQHLISKGAITAGHARALLALPSETEQHRVANLIVKKGLSVREAEEIASKGRREKAGAGRPAKDHHITDLESQLAQHFGTRVKIFHGKKKGRIQIEYYSHDDLNRILEILISKKS